MKLSTRKLTLGAAVLAAGVFSAAQQASAAAFTPGDLVTYRVGDGTQTLANTGNSVFLDEYTPTGAFVQSIAVPTATGGGSNALLASGTATSEGMLNLSANGQYLAITGYNANLGGSTVLTSSSSATVNRTVDIFDSTGTIASSTLLSDFATGNNPRSAVASNDGQSFYAVGGAGGIRYATVGATTSTQLSTTTTNFRNVNISGGQLYVSSSSGTTRLATVGTGTPTSTGQTITNLPGVSSTNSSSPYQFAFADLSSTVAGLDTLYVADDSTSGGIQKFSLGTNGNWTLTGTILTTSSVRGLTLSVTGGTVNIYATSGGTASTTTPPVVTGSTIFSYADGSGYNTLAANAAATSIVTAASNEAFRGIAFVPTTAVPEPTTVLGGLLLLGAAGWTLRRRLALGV